MVNVPLTKIKCSKCGHVWIPKQQEVHICPNCKCALSKHPPKVSLPAWKGKGFKVEQTKRIG